MSLPTIDQNSEHSGAWFLTLAKPPIAAIAVLPAFGDLIRKSELQLETKVSNLTFMHSVRKGLPAAPTVGFLVGTQLILEERITNYFRASEDIDFKAKVQGAATVGTISVPAVAVFNGQTMGWGAMKSLRRLAPKQAAAIVIQETAFVGGVSAKDEIAPLVREYTGDNAAVDYATAYFSGALGSILGHPANTALTRWQNGMVVESVSQSMLGAARKARGVGLFSMLFAIGNDTVKLIAERGEG